MIEELRPYDPYWTVRVRARIGQKRFGPVWYNGLTNSERASALSSSIKEPTPLGIYIPNESELESQGGDFALMPEDLYVVEVVAREDKKNNIITPDTVVQPNPFNKTEEFPAGKPRPVLFVTLKAISFANGDALVDENGDEPKGDPLFFAYLDTEKVGLKPRPSNFRKFITAAFGRKVEESVNIDSWADLVGKRLIVLVKHTDKGKHKVDDYQPIRARRRAAAAPAAAASAPAASDEEAMAKAAEAFGDDAPSF